MSDCELMRRIASLAMKACCLPPAAKKSDATCSAGGAHPVYDGSTVMRRLMLAVVAAFGVSTITPLLKRSEWRSAAHSAALQPKSSSAPGGSTSVSASR